MPSDFKRKPKVCRYVLFEPSVVTAKTTDYCLLGKHQSQG